MMSRLVPKRRFKEFSEEWEEKPILDIASMKARIGWQNLRQDEHLITGDYYLITGTDFNNGIINWKNAKYVEYERYIQDENIILEEGDILITKDGSIGKLAYVENIGDKKATLNNGIFRIRIKDENSKFIYYTFLSIQFRKFLQKLSAGSSINHLYQKDFVTYEVLIPKDRIEQQKIANCLSSLDNLIEAQTKKVEALKKYKKGLMQQLFPSEGKTVPKLRFDGFSGEWEEKEVDDVFDILAGGDVPKKELSDKKTQEYNIPILSNGIAEKSLYGWTNKAKIDKPSLTVSARGTIGWTSLQEKPFFPIVRLIVLTPKIKIDLVYSYYYMKKIENDYKYAKVGIPQLTKPMIKNTKLIIPKDPKEQQKIANCLSSLDNLIEVQNKKVEALKEHKKGLMQQMFVSSEVGV